VKKAKTISKTPKSESWRVQKGSERIRKVANRMGVAESSSVGDTPNAPQKTNEPQSVKLKQISDEIQTIAKEHEKSEREGNLKTAIEITTLLRWKQTIDASLNASEPTATTNPLTQILKNTEEIKEQLKTTPKQTAPTWSQIAASAASSAQILSATERKPLEQTEQRRKELKITITDQKEREELKKIDIRRLVTTLKTQEPYEATAQILAAKKLPSGDLLISTLTEKARRELEKSNSWLQAIAPTAEARRTAFPVFVHGVRVKGVNTSDQKQAVKELHEENIILHPNLEIIRVAWPKQIIKEEKIYSSLILETSSPETANKIIAQGLIHEGEIKTCVRYLSEGRVTRCFNCQKYGHIARKCRNPATCAECAENHSTNECTKEPETRRKCAVCSGNHGAGSSHCPAERREREKAATIRNLAPFQYQYQPSQPPPPIQTVSQTPSPPPSSSSQTTSRSQSQSESTNRTPIIKNHKGRPSQLIQAARNPAQMTITSVGLGKRKERDFTPPIPPPARTERNRAQSLISFSNSFETLDNLSDEDGDQ
jgi:hypothetical protein